MKQLGLLAIFAASFALAAPVVDYPPYVTAKTLYAKNDFRGKTAPEFAVEKWLGTDTPKMKGKILVIDFWATWCGPCRKLIPEMNEWAKKFKNDVVFIGLSDEKEEIVAKFMETTKFGYPVALDSQKRMSNALGVEGIPHCMVITPDNVVRWQGFPADPKDPLNEKVLQQIITASKAK
jgi:cytochrome c biogenesis protein CcmG, thiol:disulfide interchange protein DsbE